MTVIISMKGARIRLIHFAYWMWYFLSRRFFFFIGELGQYYRIRGVI